MDEASLLERAAELKNQVDAFAVSGYFSPFNPGHEEQARRAGASRPQIEFEQVPDGAESFRVRARAIGTPSLDGGGDEPPRSKER